MMAEGMTALSRREQRASDRRDQILEAARACVIAEGFHGASISRICAEASMGVGHLYKYFESKEAIMIALAERNFAEYMMHIAQSDGWQSAPDVDGLIERYLNEIPWLLDYDRAALTQEVLAEAARNPKVAKLVARIDREFSEAIRAITDPVLGSLPEEEISARIETLLIMTRALGAHASTHRGSSPALILPGFEIALRALLSPPQSSVSEM